MVKRIATGVVHIVPPDLHTALTAVPAALTTWEDVTPLARNEWICWIESAKKQETRNSRIQRACHDLEKGKRRPCCFAGCVHR